MRPTKQVFAVALLFSTNVGFVIAATEAANCGPALVAVSNLPESVRLREPSHVMVACDTDHDETIEVVAVAFDGPPAGALLVRGRDTESVNSVAIGRPNSLEVRKLQSGTPLFIVQATVGTGTGVRNDEFLIYRAKHQRLELVWRGLAYQRDFVAGDHGVIRTSALALSEDPGANTVTVHQFVLERRISISPSGEEVIRRTTTTRSEKRIGLD